MSCAAWPGDLFAITGAGMGGGRLASVQHAFGNYCDQPETAHQTAATFFLPEP